MRDPGELVLHVRGREDQGAQDDAEPRLQGAPEDDLLPDPDRGGNQDGSDDGRQPDELETESLLARVGGGQEHPFGVLQHSDAHVEERRGHDGADDLSRGQPAHREARQRVAGAAGLHEADRGEGERQIARERDDGVGGRQRNQALRLML